MFIREFSEGEPFRCAGNEFTMLLPRDETGACEAVLQMVRPGGTTPPNSHETFMQIYLFWSGEARVYIGGEMQQVRAPAVAFVPRAHRALGGECAWPTKNCIISTSAFGRMGFRRRSERADGSRCMPRLLTAM